MRIALLLCGALALSACGQKGPLYLPDKGGAVVSPPPAAGPANPATPAKKPTGEDEDTQPPK